MKAACLDDVKASVPLSPATAGSRILMLSTALGVGGGAEEQVMLLSLGLRERGWAVRIVSLLPLFPLSDELEASDIPISSLNMKRGIPDPRAIRRLMRELRDFQPDVVHCHMPQANILARVVRSFCNFPVLISTLHNLTMERMNGSSGRFLEVAHQWTDRFSDLTTVICKPAEASYIERRAVPSHKIAVVYNGVRTEQFQPDAQVRHRIRRDLQLDRQFVWLAIARLELAKDYSNLLRAFSQVVEKSKRNLTLLICGQGSLEEEVRAEVRARGLTDHVKFLGVRRDIPAIMNAADAFVISSYLEGLPMVLLQASSVGMPIVATDAGGNREIVMDGVNGLVVPPRDHKSLAAAIEKVLSLSELERRRMAEQGRKLTLEKFEFEVILNHWEKLYTERLKKTHKL